MFSEVHIPKGLDAVFPEVRIPKGLGRIFARAEESRKILLRCQRAGASGPAGAGLRDAGASVGRQINIQVNSCQGESAEKSRSLTPFAQYASGFGMTTRQPPESRGKSGAEAPHSKTEGEGCSKRVRDDKKEGCEACRNGVRKWPKEFQGIREKRHGRRGRACGQAAKQGPRRKQGQ